jgi:hypothetical protein
MHIVIKYILIIMYSLGIFVGLICIVIGLLLLWASNMIFRLSKVDSKYNEKNDNFDAEQRKDSATTVKFGKFYYFYS